MKARITQVNFTWALPGGLWVRRDTDHAEWLTCEQLTDEVGEDEAQRLFRVAFHNDWTGMWYYAGTGHHVYWNGEKILERA